MKINSIKKQKQGYLTHTLFDKALKGTVVNRALPFLLETMHILHLKLGKLTWQTWLKFCWSRTAHLGWGLVISCLEKKEKMYCQYIANYDKLTNVSLGCSRSIKFRRTSTPKFILMKCRLYMGEFSAAFTWHSAQRFQNVLARQNNQQFQIHLESSKIKNYFLN